MAAEALAEGNVCTWRIIETITETQDCIGRPSEFEVARCASSSTCSGRVYLSVRKSFGAAHWVAQWERWKTMINQIFSQVLFLGVRDPR